MKIAHPVWKIWLALAVVFLAACQPNAAAEQAAGYQPIEAEGLQGVIVPASLAEDFELSEKYWTPSEEDIMKLEASLPAFLEEIDQGVIIERLPEYMRQYVGFTFENDRLIYGNFFCNAYEIDWKKEMVFILDGGDCYFQLQYDPKNDQFLYIQFNGEA
jgi:hypothetical protein